jgi:hypothetical protein
LEPVEARFLQRRLAACGVARMVLAKLISVDIFREFW